jgi:hypothetical protein
MFSFVIMFSTDNKSKNGQRQRRVKEANSLFYEFSLSF